MNLKRQLLLVSLLTLVLPWAGCEFIRETESALRTSQQAFLSGTARAVAESLAARPEEFPPALVEGHASSDQVFGHRLDVAPSIDGYFDDWPLEEEALRQLHGADDSVRFAIGLHGGYLFLYVEVADENVVFAGPDDGTSFSDRVLLISENPPLARETFVFAAEAPGAIVTYLRGALEFEPVSTVQARWQDVPGGYQVEARVPRSLLGTNLGLTIVNTSAEFDGGIVNSSFQGRTPGPFVTIDPDMTLSARGLVQPGMRMIVTDRSGWRIAAVGEPGIAPEELQGTVSTWLRFAYAALVEPGTEPALAEPDPSGREQQPYVLSALEGSPRASWFRSQQGGQAIVAVAEPVESNRSVIGSVILQQGTGEILSLTHPITDATCTEL